MTEDLFDRLFAAPPAGFVAARDDAVATARAAGDTVAAREIAKLRKPTVAAWLVNLLAIRRPDLVAELVALAADLRSAQRDLRGPRLRELSAQRRGVVSALVREARALARAADPELAVGKLPLGEVEETLNAALSDVDVAERVRSGRLVRAASYAGFGELPRPQLRLLSGGLDEGGRAGRAPVREPRRRAPEERRTAERATEATAEKRARAEEAARARADRAARTAQRRELTRGLADAQRRQRRAEADLERALAAERSASVTLAEAETALAEWERRRTAAAQESDRCKLARKTAERAVTAARRRSGELQAAVESLDADA